MSRKDIVLFRRLLKKLRPYRNAIAGIFALKLLATPFALLTPLPLKIVVDSVLNAEALPDFLTALLPAAITRSSTGLLVFAVALIVVIALLNQVRELGGLMLSAYTGEKLVLDFQAQLFSHVQRLSHLYHDRQGTSDSTYRIQYDTSAIRYIAVDGIIPFISAFITLAAMLYVTFRIEWRLALVALTVSPLLFILTRMYRHRLRHQSRQIKKYESAAFSVVQEVLSALRVVKAFGQEDYEQERFVRRSSESMRARIRLSLAESGLGLLIVLTTAVGTAVVLFVGVRSVQAGALTLGELLLVMGYLAQLYDPLRVIGKKVASLQTHLASVERAFSLLDETPDVTERPDAKPLSRAKGAVAFKHVSFAYISDHPALHDLSFEVPAGSRLGIAGQTGAGKSTLVSLLTRFLDPAEGQIHLDGVDLRDYRLVDLRDQFAIVLQEPVLFSTTLAENIAYGRPGASEAEIIEAAKAANAHHFITSFPEGYDTQVGERGMRLSGGERQRVALARAFLKDAPILILDEPTSSVDLQTEAEIMQAAERLMQDRTCFMISHRLGTLENCDRVLVIAEGRLVKAIPESSQAAGEPIRFEQLKAAIEEVGIDG